MSNDLLATIVKAGTEGKLIESAVGNLRDWIRAGILPDWAVRAIDELIDAEAFEELNDRFFRYLAFGTGGMRGRTIGAVTTEAETGTVSEFGGPEHAGVGSNLLNDFTLVRATIGLYRYTREFLENAGRADPPKLVIAHDVRHFSRHFCELSASTWSRLGGVAFIFDGPRSTPQLSFSVRYLNAHAGVVITASHNPPHDNGFKAYFEDGAQVVPPHDTGIISEVNKVELADLPDFLESDVSRVITLGEAADQAYLDTVMQSLIDPEVIPGSGLKVVYSPIHGTGGVMSVPALQQAGVEVLTVAEQDRQDPQFPSVKSPNPENAEALKMAIDRAESEGADLVMATDPDCDRMAVAVRDANGKMQLITGNQIGTLLADYRITKLKEMGWIPEAGSDSVALVKTFVTTPMQDALGKAHGIKVINTLTGFKWIGEKIRDYEDQLKERLHADLGIGLDYDRTTYRKRVELLQEHSTFYVFGSEESYGYLPTDFVRDKDGNAACVTFSELAADLKKRGSNVLEALDGLYLKLGYFLEMLGQIYYEGAVGVARIQNILESYRANPPAAFNGVAVTRFTDFGRETVHDADGKKIPSQDLYFLELANGYSYAVRGSGTEPKIKFYLFARESVESADDLAATKTSTREKLTALREAIEADADGRSN
ncbi:MAG: phospho-sugar mutase [Verrucomicrobia bacterium]|nr:MAG: phospho-sugar mutase [Verrucomicrobiota bacterium]